MALLKSKLVLIILGGIMLAGIVWYSFMREDSTQLLQTKDLTTATSVDSDVVGVLLQLRSISLSGTIFTDPAFQSLQDFGREIVPEPTGRPNPFAPLNGAGVRAATSTATTSARVPARQAAPTQ